MLTMAIKIGLSQYNNEDLDSWVCYNSWGYIVKYYKQQQNEVPKY